MDARQFRNYRAQRAAEFRSWGCVLLAMFVLLQADPLRHISLADGVTGSVAISQLQRKLGSVSSWVPMPVKLAVLRTSKLGRPQKSSTA